MKPVIGMVTIYVGTELPYLEGYPVKILAVYKGAALPGHNPDDELGIARTDAELRALGGLEEHDRVEVAPWLRREGRFSFATCDPRARDLALFALRHDA